MGVGHNDGTASPAPCRRCAFCCLNHADTGAGANSWRHTERNTNANFEPRTTNQNCEPRTTNRERRTENGEPKTACYKRRTETTLCQSLSPFLVRRFPLAVSVRRSRFAVSVRSLGSQSRFVVSVRRYLSLSCRFVLTTLGHHACAICSPAALLRPSCSPRTSDRSSSRP